MLVSFADRNDLASSPTCIVGSENRVFSDRSESILCVPASSLEQHPHLSLSPSLRRLRALLASSPRKLDQLGPPARREPGRPSKRNDPAQHARGRRGHAMVVPLGRSYLGIRGLF